MIEVELVRHYRNYSKHNYDAIIMIFTTQKRVGIAGFWFKISLKDPVKDTMHKYYKSF